MLANSLARFRGLRRNARLYVISNTIQAASAGALGVLYTLFLSSLGYGPDFIGVVLVIGTIGGGLGILPASPLAARLGWRRVLLLSDLVGGVAVAVQFVFPTPPVIIVTTLGVGASVALFLVVNAPFLAANSTPTERIALFGLSTALGYLAAVAGSLLGGFLPGWMSHTALFTTLAPVLDHSAQARAYQLSLLAAGALSLPSIIPILLLRDEPPPAAETLAQAPLSPLGRVAPAIDAPILPVAGALPPAPMPALDTAKRLQLRMRLDQGLAALRGAIGRFTITQALVGFGAGMFFPYVNLYFVNQLHATTEYFGVLSALLTVLLALAALVSVPLAERFGKTRTAVVAALCSVPFLLAMGVFPLLWVVSVAFLVRSFLMNIGGTPLQAFLMEIVPERLRVVASGAYNVSFQLAGAAGSGIGGFLIAHLGFRPIFFVAAPFYLASAFLLLLWFGGRPEAHTRAAS